MLNLIFSLRYLSLVAVICSFFGSFLMFCIGTLKTYKAFRVFFSEWVPTEYASISIVDLSTKYLVHAIDAFLFGLVLLMFGFGIFRLFVTDKDANVPWLKVTHVGQLKNSLAQLIVIILFVKFLETILLSGSDLEWKALVLPCSILLLALGVKFLNLRE